MNSIDFELEEAVIKQYLEHCAKNVIYDSDNFFFLYKITILF